MRILLTPIGQSVIKHLEDNTKLYYSKREIKKSIYNPAINHNKSKSKSSRSRQRESLIKKLEKDQNYISVNDIVASKEVNINQKKITISKTVTEMYNESSFNILNSYDNNLTLQSQYPNKNITTASNFNNTSSQKLPLRNVLNEKSYTKLKSDYRKQKCMSDRLSRVDETKFRTSYETKNFLEKLEEKLEKNINLDRINLVKYLNEKHTVSSVLIKKISEMDEEQINKMNKICQIVYHNDENSKKIKDTIKEKINNLKNKEKQEYKNKIVIMGKEIDNISMILKNYEKKVNDKERYREKQNDIIKKYWEKYDIDKISRKCHDKLKSKVYNNAQLNKQI